MNGAPAAAPRRPACRGSCPGGRAEPPLATSPAPTIPIAQPPGGRRGAGGSAVPAARPPATGEPDAGVRQREQRQREQVHPTAPAHAPRAPTADRPFDRRTGSGQPASASGARVPGTCRRRAPRRCADGGEQVEARARARAARRPAPIRRPRRAEPRRAPSAVRQQVLHAPAGRDHTPTGRRERSQLADDPPRRIGRPPRPSAGHRRRQ